MNIEDKAYASGMASVFESSGMNKRASEDSAKAITEMKKSAAMFNFGDAQEPSSGFNWSSVIIPLLAAAASGYVGYQARDKGYAEKTPFENVKNYLAGIGDNLIRRVRPRPMYDFRRYIDN